MKQPKRATNGSPQFSLADIFNACKLLDGRLIIPPDYAEIAIDELERLERVAESAVELAGAVTGEIIIDSRHHAVKEILALCGVGAVVAPGDDLPPRLKG